MRHSVSKPLYNTTQRSKLDLVWKFPEGPVRLPKLLVFLHLDLLHANLQLHLTTTISSINRSATMSTPANASKESASAAPLGLPAPSDAPTTASEANNVIKLDHLGPMVVNSDGTISRISNWDNLSDIEKERSLRLLAKRNKARIEVLKEGEAEQK